MCLLPAAQSQSDARHSFCCQVILAILLAKLYCSPRLKAGGVIYLSAGPVTCSLNVLAQSLGSMEQRSFDTLV